MEQAQQRVLWAQVSSVPCPALSWAPQAQSGQCEGATGHHGLSVLGVPGEVGVVTVVGTSITMRLGCSAG